MDVIDKIAALADLSLDVCSLNHGTEVLTPLATDALTQPIGDVRKEVDENSPNILIPICSDCSESLHDDDWLLIYCLDCNSNQWLYKPDARLQYGEYHIMWLKGCPKCSDKAREVYYN